METILKQARTYIDTVSGHQPMNTSIYEVLLPKRTDQKINSPIGYKIYEIIVDDQQSV